MFDDLLDVFDRDRTKRDRNAHSQRGVRGLLARLTGDDEPSERYARRRWDDDDDDDDASMGRSSRQRRRDGLDLDD